MLLIHLSYDEGENKRQHGDIELESPITEGGCWPIESIYPTLSLLLLLIEKLFFSSDNISHTLITRYYFLTIYGSFNWTPNII